MTTTSVESPLSNSTMSRLLDGAERSLLSHGYKGSSIRRITQEAGTNVASINYYFGSKNELFAALFRRRLNSLTQQRDEALRAIEARSGYSIEDIVQAYFNTLFRLHGHAGQEAVLAILRLLITDPAVTQLASECIDDSYIRVKRRYAQALAAITPDLPVEELEWRLDVMERFTLCAIAAPGGTAAMPSCGALTELLMSMIRAGIQAPLVVRKDERLSGVPE